ncbi:MAG: M23 family metallopeptidase [Crocinitomicaceae bacterium]
MKYVAFSIFLIGFFSFQQLANEENFPKEFIANHFDWPVGKPDGEGYYNAQPFGKNDHLGEDLNAVTGGNSDLGHPIYAIANGKVSFAEDIKGGWGNIIRIVHQLPDGTFVESLYAHCDEIKVKKGDWIKKGDQIGTIGDAHGQYYAHLHFELRSEVGMPIGGGYSSNKIGYLNPLKFIELRR